MSFTPMVSVHTYTIKDPLEISKTRTPRVVTRGHAGSGWNIHIRDLHRYAE